jgi:hypothetical protein
MLNHKGDTNIMEENQFARHQEIDRDTHRQRMLIRYSRLKMCKKSDLSIDEQIFIENFETAMRLMWNYEEIDISKLLNKKIEASFN